MGKLPDDSMIKFVQAASSCLGEAACFIYFNFLLIKFVLKTRIFRRIIISENNLRLGVLHEKSFTKTGGNLFNDSHLIFIFL